MILVSLPVFILVDSVYFTRNKIRDGQILESLEANTTLTKLDLSGEYTWNTPKQSHHSFWIDNKIGDKAFTHIERILKTNKTLKTLNLKGILTFILNNFSYPFIMLENKIGNAGIKLIAKGLRFNTSIEELNLRGMKKNTHYCLGNYLVLFKQTTKSETTQGVWSRHWSQTSQSTTYSLMEKMGYIFDKLSFVLL